MAVTTLLLFVYGSLQRGFDNHGELRGAELVRAARTASEYRLLAYGPFPALAAGGTRAIHGELYRVSAALLAELDEFEGAEYVRGEVTLSDGTTAVSYLAAPALAARAPELPCDAWAGQGRSQGAVAGARSAMKASRPYASSPVASSTRSRRKRFP